MTETPRQTAGEVAARALLAQIDRTEPDERLYSVELTRSSWEGILEDAQTLREVLDAGSSPERPVHLRARRTDPGTSRAAALAATPRAGTVRARILDVFVDDHRGCSPTFGDGLTFEELEGILERNRVRTSVSGMRTRVSELVEGGWLVDSEVRRPTRFGNESIVWRLSPVGSARLSVRGIREAS